MSLARENKTCFYLSRNIAWDGDHGENGHVPKYKAYVGVRLCFRDVSFLRGSFRREKVHPSSLATVLPVFAE